VYPKTGIEQEIASGVGLRNVDPDSRSSRELWSDLRWGKDQSGRVVRSGRMYEVLFEEERAQDDQLLRYPI